MQSKLRLFSNIRENALVHRQALFNTMQILDYLLVKHNFEYCVDCRYYFLVVMTNGGNKAERNNMMNNSYLITSLICQP